MAVLVALQTDPLPAIKDKAQQQLDKLFSKDPSHVNDKAMEGAFQAEELLNRITPASARPARGFRLSKDAQPPSAALHYLYTMIRSVFWCGVERGVGEECGEKGKTRGRGIP